MHNIEGLKQFKDKDGRPTQEKDENHHRQHRHHLEDYIQRPHPFLLPFFQLFANFSYLPYLSLFPVQFFTIFPPPPKATLVHMDK